MMGGHLLAEWTDKQQFGDMFRIEHVVLKKGSNKWRIGKGVKSFFFCDIGLTRFWKM